VRRVRDEYTRSRQQHEFVNEKDYISDPKPSGYRGIHLVYRYRSDRSTEHNGRLVEIQLRSRLQHAWATAVETVGTFLDQSLKSSEGAEKWLEFFALTSSAFARAEGTPIIVGTPDDPQELKRAIRELGKSLEVRKKLEAYSQALKVAEERKMKADYFLLSFNPSPVQLSVYSYKREQLEQATNHYLELEKSQLNVPGAQAVLVSVDSLSALKRAYPNYYLDTDVFMKQLAKVLE
ncbi:MAG: RelA/SpoT domain-containing protein, partial [Thermoanaerobaculia bacterium]